MDTRDTLLALCWVCVAFFLTNVVFGITVYNISTYKIQQENKLDDKK